MAVFRTVWGFSASYFTESLFLMHNQYFMKKVLFMFAACFSLALTLSAQGGGGFQRRTAEERAAAIHQKLDSAFKLDAATLGKVDTALVTLYKAQDAKRQEMMAGGMPDRETFQAEMKKFSDAQAEILKAVLNKDQYEIWKEKIAPSMRGPRPGGGGGPPPGGGN
jgi:Skp family chaperone for outer membrane proteins